MRCRNLFVSLRGLVIFLILSLGLSFSSFASAAETAVVSVTAPGQTVEPGEQFTVSLTIEPNNAIAGAQFNLAFDPSIVTADSVEEGDLLTQDGANSYFNAGEIDNETGTIKGVFGVIISPGQTVSATGTFAVITLTAGTEGGICPLTLSNVVIGDIEGQSVPVSVINGTVSVNRPPVLNTIGNKTVNEGGLLTFAISASDPDGDNLTYSASNLPDGASFNPETRIFSWTTSSGQAGSNYPGVHFEVSDGSLTDTEDITISVTSSSGYGSGGGGDGGGGGGGDDSSVAAIINVYLSVTSTGRFTQNVTAKSIDGRVAIEIPTNTTCTNNLEQPPRTITIEERTQPPPTPKIAEIIGLIYDISSSPGGVIFNPPIDLTFKYEDNEVPQGVAEKNLVIARYDWVTEQWQNQECTVDTQSNTIITKLNHFSTYTVLAYVHPANFEVTSIFVTPQEVDLGEDVSIHALIKNTGDLTGTYEVSLKLDDAVIQTEEVTLAGGDSKTLSFSANGEAPGLHKVSIGDTLVSFTIKAPEAPPAFTTSEISVNPTEVNPGDSVEISVLVSNTGELAASYEVILMVNDVVIQSKEVTLAGSSSDIVSFSTILETIGEHIINIGDKVAVVNVKEVAPAVTEVAPPVTEAAPPVTEAAPPVTEDASSSGPEISHFSVTPIYDNETGKLISAKINYEINKAEKSGPGAELILNVFYEGEPWEEIPLLTLRQLQSEGNIGSFGYIPSQGWSTGTYIFQVELCEADGLAQSTQQQFTVTPESITKVFSWKTLGIVVSSTLILSMVILLVVLYHRRDMLRGYIE